MAALARLRVLPPFFGIKRCITAPPGYKPWTHYDVLSVKDSKSIRNQSLVLVVCAGVLYIMYEHMHFREHYYHRRRPPAKHYKNFTTLHKRFPWGDGKHSMFFNKWVNLGLDGEYETSEEEYEEHIRQHWPHIYGEPEHHHVKKGFIQKIRECITGGPPKPKYLPEALRK